MMNSAHRGGVLFALLVLSGAAAKAHTLAGTIVSVSTARDDDVNITIAAEADPLIAKLEALGGVASSEPPTTARDRRDRIASLFATLRAHIDARVASTPLVLDLRDVLVDDTAQTEIHATAKMPAGQSTFTWRCTFIFGAYQLSTRSGNDTEAIEWLQGSQTSKPVALRRPRPGDHRVAAGLAMAALMAYVIGRRTVVVSGSFRKNHGSTAGVARADITATREQLSENEQPEGDTLERAASRRLLRRTRCRTISPGRSLPSFCTKPPRSSICRG